MCSMSILNKIVDRYCVAQLIIAIVIETFMSLGAKSTIDEDDDDDDDKDFYFLYLSDQVDGRKSSKRISQIEVKVFLVTYSAVGLSYSLS